MRLYPDVTAHIYPSLPSRKPCGSNANGRSPIALHITTEVDCESLFSQAGHAAHPNCNRTVAETFERQVLNEFMERWKNKSWSEEEDRDDIEFWEEQKKEYLEQNPTHILAIVQAWRTQK
eukprot:scaffold22128_cov73-Cyclotella_meneghiniana.AAC.3